MLSLKKNDTNKSKVGKAGKLVYKDLTARDVVLKFFTSCKAADGTITMRCNICDDNLKFTSKGGCNNQFAHLKAKHSADDYWKKVLDASAIANQTNKDGSKNPVGSLKMTQFAFPITPFASWLFNSLKFILGKNLSFSCIEDEYFRSLCSQYTCR